MGTDLAFQGAVYSVLSTALTATVYDSAPPDAAYPYVTLDRFVSREEDPITGRRERHFGYLTIWSARNGQIEIKQIMATIKTALHRTSPPMDDGRIADLWVRETDVQVDSDGQTYMGSITIEAVIDP